MLKKEYILELIDRDTGFIIQTETRKSPQAFDRLWCKALENVNTLKYKIKASVVLFSLIILLVCGCGGNENIQEKNEHPHIDIKTIEIDGCEYIYDSSYNLSVPVPLTHKGNCKNPIHKRDGQSN